MRKALYWVLIGIFALIFILSAYIVVDYLIEAKQADDDWEELSGLFDETQSSTGSSSSATVPDGTQQNIPTSSLVPEPVLTIPTPPPQTIVTEPEHEHSYTEEVVAPTCTQLGFTIYSCECGHVYHDTVTDPVGHSFGSWTYSTSTSEEDGLPRSRKCTDCGETQEQNILDRFRKLYRLNPELVGYIRIVNDDTVSTNSSKYYLINYPILQSPDHRDFYIDHNFYGQEDKHGAIYLREACDMFAPTDVLTIYGHNMSDGSMFAGLHKYLTKSYFNSHQTITMWDLYEEHTYQVVCLFKTSGTYGVGFPFHLFDNFADEAEYEEFINGVRELAIYDSGIETQYGDKFICLCTCEYTTIDPGGKINGRLVLVAKRVS